VRELQFVVVTGAASGIGRETALLCASLGARLLVSDRRPDRLHETALRCGELGAASVAEAVADMTSRDDCLSLVARASEVSPGGVDLLALVAGVSMDFDFAETRPQASAFIVGVILFGPAWIAQQAIPLLAATRGRVLVVSSMSALLPRARRTWYAASKAAVKALFENMRFELARAFFSLAPGGLLSFSLFLRCLTLGCGPQPSASVSLLAFPGLSRQRWPLECRASTLLEDRSAPGPALPRGLPRMDSRCSSQTTSHGGSLLPRWPAEGRLCALRGMSSWPLVRCSSRRSMSGS
jgi:NAD(P)-dependent dehydrogenase (short-subunit alcohol dehydrogenase family)